MAAQGEKATKQFSLSTNSMGSDEDLKLYCQPCAHDGLGLPAHGYCTNCSEHLCETCFTGHRRHNMSRHHTLLDKANMPQTMLSVTPSHSDNWTKQCPKHNIEMIEFYCHDHKALLCSVCVTLEHTPASCNVNYIPDVSDQIINSKEYQDILKALIDMTKKADKTLQDTQKKNDQSSMSLNDVLKDIKAFRTKINQSLDELERQVEETAKVIQKENGTKLTEVERECKDLLKSLKVFSDAITQFNTLKQANELFMEVKQAGKMIKDYEQSVAKIKSLDVKEYYFEPNEEISNLLSKEKSIGMLKSRSMNFNLMPRKVTNKDKIYIKTAKDSRECWITGMTLLTPNLLVVTDYYNEAVKMVDISKMSVLDQHKLDTKLWDVSSVSHDEIAVTFPYKQSIQFMSVSRNILKKHLVKVDGEYRGISCHKGKMAVTFTDPPMVQILLIDGTVLQTIQEDNIFSLPRYVTTSDNCIYVSDYHMRTITKLKWQGEVKDIYDCRRWPYGLTMSDDENVFVCSDDDNTIREILGNFTKEQNVVKNIQGPRVVCWSAETCTLYTSSRTLFPNEDNFIKMFKIST